MTERQKTFARLLAADPLGNKTKAAIGAGCPPKSAPATATKWLKKSQVIAEIERFRAKASQKLDISAERVLRQLAFHAFKDMRKLFDDDGNLKAVKDLDEETAAAIAGLEYEKLFDHFGKGQAKHVGTTTKVKFSDSVRALELLGKWKGNKLFEENVNVTGLDGLADRLNQIRKRKQHGDSGN